MLRTFILGSLALLLAGGPARAQQTWTRKVRAYANGRLDPLPDGGSIAYQLTPIPDYDVSMLRHVVFDSVLHQRHQATLPLRGFEVSLAGHALNRQAALYRFRRKLNDTAVTAVIDTAGRVLSYRREERRLSSPDLLTTLPVSSDSLFVLCNQRNSGKGFELECLDLHQQVRWKLPFTATKGQLDLVSYWADARYLWLVTGDNADSGLTQHAATCLDLRTGRVVSRTLLDRQGTRRFVTATLLQPDHSLVLTGRTFYSEDGKRISLVRTGDLFLTRLLPDGSRPLDHVSPVQSLQNTGILTNQQVYWQQLGADARGQYFLLGETYSSSSAIGAAANGLPVAVLTLGVLKPSFTSLTSREIVRVQFDAQGQVSRTSLVALPPGQAITDLGAIPAQLMAAYADSKGIFRLRGTSPDGRVVLVRNQHDLSLLNLDTQQWRMLRADQALADTDVWGVRRDQALLYYTQPVSAKPRPACEWVPLR